MPRSCHERGISTREPSIHVTPTRLLRTLKQNDTAADLATGLTRRKITQALINS